MQRKQKSKNKKKTRIIKLNSFPLTDCCCCSSSFPLSSHIPMVSLTVLVSQLYSYHNFFLCILISHKCEISSFVLHRRFFRRISLEISEESNNRWIFKFIPHLFFSLQFINNIIVWVNAKKKGRDRERWKKDSPVTERTTYNEWWKGKKKKEKEIASQ